MRALLAVALLLAVPGGACGGTKAPPAGLRDAIAARALLGPAIWARVVRIDNAGPRGAGPRNAYPLTVYATVFELSGILWFYCDADGTQSLSVRRGSPEADKADPGPLLRAISGQFGAWGWVDVPEAWREPGAAPPPNACFIECLAALRRRIAAGARADSPRLLSYYVDTPTGRLGHTVLLFDDRGVLTALDPGRGERPVAVPAGLGADARCVSRFLRGRKVASARVLPVVAEGPPGRWAALPPAAVPAA